jgi:hypothetical protein
MCETCGISKMAIYRGLTRTERVFCWWRHLMSPGSR